MDINNWLLVTFSHGLIPYYLLRMVAIELNDFLKFIKKQTIWTGGVPWVPLTANKSAVPLKNVLRQICSQLIFYMKISPRISVLFAVNKINHGWPWTFFETAYFPKDLEVLVPSIIGCFVCLVFEKCLRRKLFIYLYIYNRFLLGSILPVQMEDTAQIRKNHSNERYRAHFRGLFS